MPRGVPPPPAHLELPELLLQLPPLAEAPLQLLPHGRGAAPAPRAPARARRPHPRARAPRAPLTSSRAVMGAAPPPRPPQGRDPSGEGAPRSGLTSGHGAPKAGDSPQVKAPLRCGSPPVTAPLRPAIPSHDGPLRRGPRQACALLRPELPSDGGGVPSAAVARPAPVTFWRPCASPEPPCVVAAPKVLRGVAWKHLAVLSGWFITHGAESGDKTLHCTGPAPSERPGG